MNVGIYTRWQRRDSTYAAVQVADLMSRWQHEVDILTPTPRRPPVSSFWDERIRHDARLKFTEWAGRLDTLIWTSCPHAGQVAWANKAGKQTVLVPDWADDAAIAAAGPAFSKIMAPSACWVDHLRGRGARNIVPCAWSPMLPVTRRSHDGGARVYVPPVDRPDGDEALAVDVVEAMFVLDPTATATVSTDGRRNTLAKRLARLAKAQPRLILDRPSDYHHQVLRYGDHDLTLLSAASDNFGMSALCSLHMGTPVVGFDVQPLDEVASPANSVLVACRAAGCPPGESPVRVGDQKNLLEAVMALVDQPARLGRLFAGCAAGLERRRGDFESAWAGVAPAG